MNGLTEVKAKLLADSAVVASTGTYLTKPAIYGQPLAPNKYEGKAITMYNSLPINGGLNYGSYGITVNNFGKKYSDVSTMQEAVFDALNRHAEGEATFFRCTKLQIISPRETGGDYNAPVEVLTRQR